MSRATCAPPTVVNRLREVLLHVPYYSIQGPARLAKDAALSRSTLSRLCRHKMNPSYAVAEAIAWAISKRVGFYLDARELFSPDGSYPTPSTCRLLGCKGCLPPEAWNEETDTLRPKWRNQKPGDWSRQQASPIHPATIV